MNILLVISTVPSNRSTIPKCYTKPKGSRQKPLIFNCHGNTAMYFGFYPQQNWLVCRNLMFLQTPSHSSGKGRHWVTFLRGKGGTESHSSGKGRHWVTLLRERRHRVIFFRGKGGTESHYSGERGHRVTFFSGKGVVHHKCPMSRSPSYPTLLDALATPWDSVKQCSMGTLSLVPRTKVTSSGTTLITFSLKLVTGIKEVANKCTSFYNY